MLLVYTIIKLCALSWLHWYTLSLLLTWIFSETLGHVFTNVWSNVSCWHRHLVVASNRLYFLQLRRKNDLLVKFSSSFSTLADSSVLITVLIIIMFLVGKLKLLANRVGVGEMIYWRVKSNTTFIIKLFDLQISSLSWPKTKVIRVPFVILRYHQTLRRNLAI